MAVVRRRALHARNQPIFAKELIPITRMTLSVSAYGDMKTFASVHNAARKLIREVCQIGRIAGARTSLQYLCAIFRHRNEIIRSGRLLAADGEMAGAFYRMRVMGTVILVPGVHFGLARELYGRMCYFAIQGFNIKAGDTVVDLGANCGLFSVLAARLGARVVAVEAQFGFIKELRKTAELNKVPNRIVVEWALIGSRSGELSNAENLAGSSHWEGRKPPDATLRLIVRNHNISRINFLKVDIEGSEFDLFSGEHEVLQQIDKIAMEIHTEHGSPLDVSRPLRDAGFATALLSPELLPITALSTKLGYLFAWRH